MNYVFYCDLDKIRAAGERYVDEGSAVLRAERQRDVDGALTFLQSDAAAKLRPDGLQPKEAPVSPKVTTVLQAMEEAAHRG
jgi:hypothetical protein